MSIDLWLFRYTAFSDCMPSLRRVIVDVLRPHDPPLATFTEQVAATRTVMGATASLLERDQTVQTIVLTLEGDDLDLAAITAAIESLGGSVHSVDQVSFGERLVDPGRPLPESER